MEKWIRKSDKNSLWVFSFNSIHLCAEFFVFDSYFFRARRDKNEIERKTSTIQISS